MKPTSRLIYITASLATILLYNCARQTTPEGGPKDVDKPVLIKSSPPDKQRNFKGKKLELLFSEDIKLKDPKEEILITPSPGKETKFIAAGNKVTIDPQFPWKDSTTYNILFRESVQDVTESNPTEELHLAFSTGPNIDSLSISGNVKEALKETTPEKITVAIYSSDTFNIFNHQSSYLTKSDKTGNFKISNLKPGRYFIYAYDDKNKNLKVESTNEKYGFKSKPIELTKNKDSITITLVNIDSRPIKLNSNRSNSKTALLRFNKNIITYSIEQNENKLLNTFGDNQTEIVLYFNELIPLKDSTKIRVLATDSLNQKFDSLIYIKQVDTKSIKTSYSISTELPKLDYETGRFELKGKTNIPTSKFNIDSIFIQIDTITIIHFKKENLNYNEITKKFVITSFLDTTLFTKRGETIKKKEVTTRSQAPPSIILGKAFLISIYNDSSKRQSITLPTKQQNKTGSLLVRIDTKEKNYTLELLDASNHLLQSITAKHEYKFEKIGGSEYKLRAYIDQNNNGRWDPGNITLRVEPEPVFYYQTNDKKYSIPVRENWDVGPYNFKF